ncbi:uncharacterized protein LOC118433967 isoform X2 [Folsomia candida]|uniref:uncharacterized protein LOC118433967 isoform X2 n=1 Tax=Folsomia candida TaxID=158441 RepID=UPI001604AC1C|nr:uncharacterized protein LOC118433967 isoform X2 [Folsomia candida]
MSTMFVAATTCKNNTSTIKFSPFVSTSKEFVFAYIMLTGGRRQNEICGKLNITQQKGNKVSNIHSPKSDKWHHYALVVEFHGQLASTAFEDNNKPLPQLVPDATSELICNSKIFALVSGTENGIKKQLNLKEQTYILARNPASFPFRILLPENHDQLPSSLKSSNLSVEYFLVCYLRTEHGYEELDKRPLHFRGHNLITFQNECKTVSWTTSTNQVTIVCTSPQRYYRLWVKQPVLFTVTLDFEHEEEESSLVFCEVSVVQRISMGIEVTETVVDSRSESKWMKRLNLTFCGKLLDPKIGGHAQILLPSYNQDDEGGVKVQHFLKFKVVLPMELAGDSLEHLEEIFIGTGRLLTASETNKGPGLFSRIRSQSVSSLLSLFPPSYSGLPSRRGSQISLETLPPHYDDLSNPDETMSSDQE